MPRRILYGSLVVLLWCVSMTWLVTSKIVTPSADGPPRGFQAMADGEAVSWRISVDGEPIGWVVQQVEAHSNGTRVLRSKLELSQVRLGDFAPGWLKHLTTDIPPLAIEATSRVEFDALGHLSSLEAFAKLREMPFSLRLNGRASSEGLQLNLRVLSPQSLSFETSIPLPESAQLSERLMPQARLEGLVVGQSWTVQSISPFDQSNMAESLIATVADEDYIAHGGMMEPCLRVVFRGTNQSGISEQQNERFQVWVSANGEVLRQEVMLGERVLRFDLRASELTQRLADAAFGETNGNDQPPRGDAKEQR